MIGCLIAYDDAGEIVFVLDYVVSYDETKPDRPPVGFVDFMGMEASGFDFSPAVWTIEGAKGSKAWPEWLGHRIREYRVELAGPPGDKRISALVHKESGKRRERSEILAKIEKRIRAAGGGLADIRDIVGGPGKPVDLDD